MSEEELIETLKEFEKSRVEQLKEPSKNLFYAIMKIADERDKYKIILDKIKEYCNHKLEMLELQKRNIMQILTPENGYLKTNIEIEMQKYKDILELLEEIE